MSCNRIGRVETVVSEVAGERACILIGAGLRNGIDLHAHRAPLAGIDPTRELEFGNRVTAVARLPEAKRHHVGHLLAIQVHLHADAGGLGRNRYFAHCVHAAAGREHRQIHPVTALDGQLLHLTRIDIARGARPGHIDQRRFSRDGDGLLQRGRLQLDVEVHLLADKHLEPRSRHACESGQFSDDSIRANADGNAVPTLTVRDGFKGVSRRLVDGANDDTG